jgi:hypothetical protein
MARFAVVASNNAIVSFSTVQTTYDPLKGDAAHPAPWRSLPCPVVAPPAFDPATEIVDGPTYTVNPTDVTEVYTKRVLTAPELQANKDGMIAAMDVALLKIAFNHENRIRAIEKPAPTPLQLTIAQFKAAIMGLL